MRYLNRLPDAKELVEKYPLSEQEIKARKIKLEELRNVFVGIDNRKVLLIGPCSADDERAVLEYAIRMAPISEMIKSRYVVVLRVYTGKPRTNGKGYKGLLHRPNANSEYDDLVLGIEKARNMHKRIVCESGMFTADELLYPDMFSYLEDLLVYAAVGARSVENQQHRLISSGLDIPVGMKNPTGGNLQTMLNSIIAAQSSQHLMYSGWEVETDGNQFVHAILRGYMDEYGKDKPNYHYEDICNLYDLYIKLNLSNPSVIIDCNHSNSGKRYEEQSRIAGDVLGSCKRNITINRFVKGLMIESYLEDGSQQIGGGVFGKSITDSCIGWKRTLELIDVLMA